MRMQVNGKVVPLVPEPPEPCASPCSGRPTGEALAGSSKRLADPNADQDTAAAQRDSNSSRRRFTLNHRLRFSAGLESDRACSAVEGQSSAERRSKDQTRPGVEEPALASRWSSEGLLHGPASPDNLE